MNAQLVLFTLDDQRYALALSSVERVARIVEITPLPGAPAVVLGVINVQGSIIAVYDPRKRFGLPRREIRLSDQLIIARTSRRQAALVADAVTGVLEVAPDKIIAADRILNGIERVRGIVRLADGLVLIHDLEQFLSPEEERSLSAAVHEFQRTGEALTRNG
ncbi:MAG TPA: chemotaxis protein CheW [Candidatus Acidoferrales bacterium]|nr:chemotaxis protein CheW [Candidatus Acidoferrales bacterium]